MKATSIIRLAALVGTLVVTWPALAQSGGSYTIKKSTTAGGGGSSTGGTYTVWGTAGQHDADTLTGGTYLLKGGFWTGGAVPSSPLAAATPHDARKHRYISIDATTNPTADTSIKVEIAEMNRCSGDARRSGITDDDCPSVCQAEPDLHSCGDGSICPDGVCIETGPCVPHPDVGLSWFVQEPQTRGAACPNGMCDEDDYYARVDAVVYGSDWKDECEDVRIPGWTSGCATLHIGDCEIVPGVKYNVYACHPVLGGPCSDPLQVETTRKPELMPHFGDIASVGGPSLNFGPPDDYTNVIDIGAYLLTNKNWGTSNLPRAHPTWIDLVGLGPGRTPDYILNISDLNAILSRGRPP